MNKLICILVFIGVAIETLAQSPPASLMEVVYSNIYSNSAVDGCSPGYPCIDNRSQFTRQSSITSYKATGSGTWAVDMQFADVVPITWTSFGSTGQVSNTGPSSGIGYGIGPAVVAKPYHDYIRFVITCTPTVTPCPVTIYDYSGTKRFWWVPSVAAIGFPITANQGGTYGAFVVDQLAGSPSIGCTEASNTQTLVITQPWTGMTTQTLACSILFLQGGSFEAASGQTVTLTGSITAATYQQIFVPSGGGAIRLLQREQNAAWFGACGTETCYMSGTDSTLAVQSALNSVAYSCTAGAGGVGVLNVPSGVYNVGSLTQSGSCNPSSIIGAGSNSTIFIFNGTSGAVFLSATGSNTSFTYKGINFQNSSGHTPSTILSFGAQLDVSSQLEDIAVSGASGDCILVGAGYVNLYWTKGIRFDACGGSGLHVIYVNGNFQQSFALENFTATVTGGFNEGAIVYFDASAAGSNNFSNAAIGHARLEIGSDTTTMMGPPYAVFRFNGNNDGFVQPNIHDVNVQDVVGQTGLFLLYSNRSIPFVLDNVFPFSESQGLWFGGTGWTPLVTGLQGTREYISHVVNPTQNQPTAQAYFLGGPPTCCNPAMGVTGVTAALSTSSAWTQSNSGFTVSLVMGGSPSTTTGQLVIGTFSDTPWGANLPSCLGQVRDVLGAVVRIEAISSTEFELYGVSGLTASTTYDVQGVCF